MNANQVRAFGDRSAKVGVALWGGTIKMQGVDYAVAVVKAAARSELMEGYEENQVRQVVRLRKALHPTMPVRDGFAFYAGKSWQIREVTGEDPCDAEWVLALERKK